MDTASSRTSLFSRLWQLLSDRILPASFELFLAAVYLQSLQMAVHTADWLVILTRAVTVFGAVASALMYVIRFNRVGERSNLFGAILALSGSYLGTILFFLAPQTNGRFEQAGVILTLFGQLWAYTALLVLGRCWGLFPEARGLVTRLHYSVVRHPKYLGYIVALFGTVLIRPSWYALLVWLLATVLEARRAIEEEKALEKVFPVYADYSRRVKRLIPFVW